MDARRPIVCFSCGPTGHMRRKCPKRSPLVTGVYPSAIPLYLDGVVSLSCRGWGRKLDRTRSQCGQVLGISAGRGPTSVCQRAVKTACTVLGGYTVCPGVDRRLNPGGVCDTVLLRTNSACKAKSAVGTSECRVCGPGCC